jgi:hypothetical protein
MISTLGTPKIQKGARIDVVAAQLTHYNKLIMQNLQLLFGPILLKFQNKSKDSDDDDSMDSGDV